MKSDRLTHHAIRGILTVASKLTAVVSPLFVDSEKVDRITNLPYGTHGNRLDAFVPKNGTPGTRFPITLLIHGGGFGFFSKDSHAAAAAQSAAQGRLTFSIDYRLTPKHPYPAGLIDTIEAYHWILENAGQHNGDVNQISVMGESAGGNYALALCLYLFGLGDLNPDAKLPPKPRTLPKSAVIHCGYLEVTYPERLKNDPRCSSIAVSRMVSIQKSYLPESVGHDGKDYGLANPLVVLESLASSGAKLPPDFPEIFVPVGENDPVISDSERLGAALDRLGQKGRLKVYPGVGHAFYTFVFKESAKEAWKDIDQAVKRHSQHAAK